MIADLHTHTTASDGKLSSVELIQRAEDFKIDMLSITDHDTTDAYTSTSKIKTNKLMIIPGVEFSTFWKKTEIHILGSNIQLDNDAIRDGVIKQRQLRRERAEKIAIKLEKVGLENPLAGASEIANNQNIGRPHFAEYMVNIGFVKDFNHAFNKYLSTGKPCYCRQNWSEYAQIIEWIKAGGGIAVLAHPAKYKLTTTKLLELLDDFKKAGGEGMEIINGKQTPILTKHLAGICEKMKLYASCGSDFHQTGQSWSELGQFPKIPNECTPVWENW